MNTNRVAITLSLFLFFIFGILSVHLLWQSYAPQQSRQIANLVDKANPDWTEGQKIKWAVTKQFKIDMTDQTFSIEAPHAANLCEGQFGLRLVFIANEVMISGQNPQIQITIACDKLLALENFQIQFQIRELLKLRTHSDFQLNELKISSEFLYQDEEWPTAWQLSALEILGPAGFLLNQYEIQEAHQRLYSIKLDQGM